MRAGKIVEIIEDNIGDLPKEFKYFTAGYKVEARKLVETLREINKIPGVQKAVEGVFREMPAMDASGNAYVSNSYSDSLNAAISVLRTQLILLLNALRATIAEPEEGSVYLRLPEVRDIAGMAQVLSLIDRSFNELFSGNDAAPQIRLKGVESGSIWLSLLVVGSGVRLFYTTIVGAISVGEKVQNLRKNEAEIRRLELGNDILEQQAKLNQILVQAASRAVAKDLLTQYNIDPTDPRSNEQLTKYMRAIEALGGVFAQGAKVDIPKIAAQSHEEEVKKVVETMAKLENVDGDKLLLPGNDESN